MAGVFKSLDKSDIRLTPFRAYKLWDDTIGNEGTGSVYSVYQADYNPYSNYLSSDPLKDTFDQGNPYFEGQEPITVHGKYQRVVHASINHLYYKNFYTNNKASFGSGDINKQVRFLEDKAQVISIPQSKFGEALLPESIKLTISRSFVVGNTPTSSLLTITDDLYGNLQVSGGFLSPYNEVIGGAFTNYSSSISKKPVGEWPFDELYKYTDIGYFSHTSSFNRGYWEMESLYTNIGATFLSGGFEPFPTDKNLLGAVMLFTSSLSSSVEIKASIEPAYNHFYNFENSDFAISMMVMPTATPTHPSGAILVSKQGPTEETKVDINGSTYSSVLPNKSPYRISYTSGSNKVQFEKDTGYGLFTLTSSLSLSLNELNHVMVIKTGSLITLNANNANNSSSVSASFGFRDRDSSNQSNIFIGNSYAKDQGFTGVIDNVKIYKNSLNSYETRILHHTLGVGDTAVGNVFYNHGMIVLTAIPTYYSTVKTVESRGTHTIWETEISCTIGPGEFGMSMNPSLMEYDSQISEYVFKPYTTGSEFKPFITTIGLYDDRGQMLAVGKVNTPIQTPNNMDTTFIIRFDR